MVYTQNFSPNKNNILLLCSFNDTAMSSSIINLSDKDLLVAKDDELAFRILYERYWLPLYNKAVARLGNEAAQDVVQEIFISLWKNKTNITITDTLSPYLFTALRYAIIKQVHRKAKKGILLPLSITELEVDPVTQPDHLQYNEMERVIKEGVAELPERMQEIYKLSRVDNLKIEEIAGRLNLSKQTVKNTLSTTIKRLRQRLADYAGIFLFFL
jgi:RNA polymerase sigma-70 factor (ECF subfamily)